MKREIQQYAVLAIGLTLLLIIGAADQASAYQVTLSLYNQGFDINKFYNNGDFDVEAGIVNADPTSLLVIVGDPANVEEVFETPDQATTFELLAAGSDFHFEIAQPFRFQDRFDGLFSTTVDDPVLFVPDNGTVTAFRDDGLLADDRIDLDAYEAELPPMYVEVDYGDTITMTTYDGTKLFITRVWRNPDFTVTFDISDVPEPGTVVLLGLGLIGIIGFVKRKSMRKKCVPIVRLFIVIGLLLVCCTVLSSTVMADEIEDKIMQKWQQMRDNGLDIGEPTREVVGAWGSPYGTGGYVRFFENGDIYYHGNGLRAGQVFEIHGRIYRTFNREGDTTSFLGFPISNEKRIGPFGYPVNYFEGGCITSENGLDYFAIEDCRENEPTEPLGLRSVTPRNSCIELKNGKHELSEADFVLDFGPYTRPSYSRIEFEPPVVQFPLSDRTMSRDVSVEVNEVKTIEDITFTKVFDTSFTIVNPDISFEMSPEGIQFDFLRKVKTFQKFFDTLNDKIKKYVKFGAFCNPDFKFSPAIEVGSEISKICCSDPTGVKDALKLYIDFSCDFGGISCKIPVFPLPFGFRANLVADAGLATSFNLHRKTSCESRSDVCGDFELKIDAGLGGSVTDISGGKMLDGSLKGKLNPSVSGKGCYNLSTKEWDFTGEACITPKVVAELKLASFIKKSATLNIGGKKCQDF